MESRFWTGKGQGKPAISFCARNEVLKTDGMSKDSGVSSVGLLFAKFGTIGPSKKYQL